jgi:hypothetical protein
MQGQVEADTTTGVTHSKLPSHSHPWNGSLIQSRAAYNLNDGVVVGYVDVAATIRLRSSHHRSSSPDEPHLDLNNCGITRSLSDSTSCRDGANRETLFRPIDFDNVSIGMCRSLVPLTLPESRNTSRSGSSDRGMSSSWTNEDELHLPDILLVQIPRRPSDPAIDR